MARCGSCRGMPYILPSRLRYQKTSLARLRAIPSSLHRIPPCDYGRVDSAQRCISCGKLNAFAPMMPTFSIAGFPAIFSFICSNSSTSQLAQMNLPCKNPASLPASQRVMCAESDGSSQMGRLWTCGLPPADFSTALLNTHPGCLCTVSSCVCSERG